MQALISFFVRHPTAANLLMIAILVSGLLSLGFLRRETFPDFRPREVRVTVPYPGANSRDVEEGVLQRIEDAIDGVRFVEEVRGDARTHLGSVTIEMTEGGEWTAFKDEIDTAIASIDDFPDRTEEPLIEELHTTDPVLNVIVAGDMLAADLKGYAEELKNRLQQVPDVSLIEIEGFSERQLRVELSKPALIRHGVSTSDVAAAMARQGVDLPAGEIETGQEDLLLRFDERRETAETLGDLVVLADPQGGQIRLRDLGTVVDDFRLAEEKVVSYPRGLNGGRRAALLQIEKTKGQDTLVVADAVKRALQKERAERPAVDLIVTSDISRLVADRLALLVKNGLQGMLLVFAVMWLFFNTRFSFWVVVSLPVSFLGAFVFLPPLDITINMLSMVALLLGIGILMDDGIVIAENVASHSERGGDPDQAATQGVREVSGGVISSFLTTTVVLGPLAFLAGNIGRVLEVVPIVLLLVLAVSLIEAFLILPHHLARSLRPQRNPARFRRAIDQRLEWVRGRLLRRAVDRLIRWRYPWVGVVVAVFLVSLTLPISGWLEFQALPELDGNTIAARVLMPQGTPLEQTERVIKKLVDAIRKVDQTYTPEQPNQRPLVEAVFARFNRNADAFEQGPHVATLEVELLEAETRTVRVDKLLAAWRREAGTVADAVTISFLEPMRSPTGRNIEIRVRGGELGPLRDACLEMKQWLTRFRGVENLTTDLRPGKREFTIGFRPGTLGAGLEAASMAKQLRAAFQGQQAIEIQVGSESYELEARLNAESQASRQDLESFRFTLPDGSQAPLSSVATITPTRGWSRIARVDGLRTATLRGDVDTRVANTAAILDAFRREFVPELTTRFPGVEIDFEGEVAETAITRRSLERGLLIGIIGVFILLSYQFRTYTEPFIVMTAVPMALVGVIWGHVVMGYPLTLPSMIGFASLAGVVVNDSILLVIFLKRARREGMSATEAAGQASYDRFRAILITSLTTIAGLIPLTLETSLQAQILIPLAVSIVFGLLASTFLVLLVIPCLYVILYDLGCVERLD